MIAQTTRLALAPVFMLVAIGTVMNILSTRLGLLFVEEIGGLNLQRIAAATFFVAVALLMGALMLFLHETRIATAALRIPKDFLELDRQL